jgi:predicted transcriptional regulator
MKPVDFRNATWADVQARVSGLRRRTLLALQAHGPCTTRALAAACDADVLTIRPRVTELIQLGLVQLVPGGTRDHEGVYRALSAAEAESLFARIRATARSSTPP